MEVATEAGTPGVGMVEDMDIDMDTVECIMDVISLVSAHCPAESRRQSAMNK